MILWLDDIRKPHHHGYIGAEWAKNYDEAIKALKTGLVTFADLDHDLSEQAIWGLQPSDEKSGYDVVLWMREKNVWPVDGVKVHSMNAEGARKMREIIAKAYEGKELPVFVVMK